MTIRLREMEAVTELRELRVRLMELETQVKLNANIQFICKKRRQLILLISFLQNQVLSNQLKRQDEEIKSLLDKAEASERLDKEHLSKIKEHERKYADLEAKMREDSMLSRIRDAENSQHVAELSQKISQLEMKVRSVVAVQKFTVAFITVFCFLEIPERNYVNWRRVEHGRGQRQRSRSPGPHRWTESWGKF